MSGVIDPRHDAAPASESAGPPPRALADLAASLQHAGASASVEQRLDEAWRAMHAPEPAASVSGPARRLAPVWACPVLGAAAALVVALRLWPPVAPPLPPVPAPVGMVAAVPAGPLEPPPPTSPVDGAAVVRPTPAEVPAGTRPALTVRAAAQGVATDMTGPAAATAPDDVEPFVWIRGADEIEPGLGLRIVRVQLPRVRWDTGTPRPELVNADVLMGSDGQARAVRVAWTDGR